MWDHFQQGRFTTCLYRETFLLQVKHNSWLIIQASGGIAIIHMFSMFVNLPFAMAPGLVMRMAVCGQMMFDAYMALWPGNNEYSDVIELICCTMAWN